MLVRLKVLPQTLHIIALMKLIFLKHITQYTYTQTHTFFANGIDLVDRHIPAFFQFLPIFHFYSALLFLFLLLIIFTILLF